jgi:hypothetical protein
MAYLNKSCIPSDPVDPATVDTPQPHPSPLTILSHRQELNWHCDSFAPSASHTFITVVASVDRSCVVDALHSTTGSRITTTFRLKASPVTFTFAKSCYIIYFERKRPFSG